MFHCGAARSTPDLERKLAAIEVIERKSVDAGLRFALVAMLTRDKSCALKRSVQQLRVTNDQGLVRTGSLSHRKLAAQHELSLPDQPHTSPKVPILKKCFLPTDSPAIQLDNGKLLRARRLVAEFASKSSEAKVPHPTLLKSGPRRGYLGACCRRSTGRPCRL
jgi:hypothetical protein